MTELQSLWDANRMIPGGTNAGEQSRTITTQVRGKPFFYTHQNVIYVHDTLGMRWVTTQDGVSEWCHVGKGVCVE